MTKDPPVKKKSMSSTDRRAADAKRDVEFFAERKAKDASNLAKTEKLRAQRLAHEASGEELVYKRKINPEAKTKKKVAQTTKR